MTDLFERLRRAGDLLDDLDHHSYAGNVRHGRTWHPRVLIGCAAALALVVVGLRLVPEPSPSTSLTAVGETIVTPSAARVLPAAHGWSMSSVELVTATHGQVTFADGGGSAELTWAPTAPNATIGAAANATEEVIAGMAGIVGSYGPSDQVAMWSRDKTQVVLRGAMPRGSFESLVVSLRAATVEEWIKALPPSAERRSGPALDQILAGVPLPPGTTTEDIRSRMPDIASHYQLTSEATGQVVCRWIAQWFDADRRGDVNARAAAVNALDGSRSWRSLLTIEHEGGWSQSVWDIADMVAGRSSVPGGGPALTVAAAAEGSLGCKLPPP